MNAQHLRELFVDAVGELRSAGRGASRETLAGIVDKFLPGWIGASDPCEDLRAPETLRAKVVARALAAGALRADSAIPLNGYASPTGGIAWPWQNRKARMPRRSLRIIGFGLAGAAALLAVGFFAYHLLVPAPRDMVRHDPKPRAATPKEMQPRVVLPGPTPKRAPKVQPDGRSLQEPQDPLASGERTILAGRLGSVMGEPQVWPRGAQAARTAVPGMDLAVGDILETGDADKLELRFNDGSVVRMDFNTRLVVPNGESTRGYVASNTIPIPRPERIGLESGKVSAQIAHLEDYSNLRIETPAATAEVLGTEFELSVQRLDDPKGRQTHRVQLKVNKGRVAFYNALGRVEALSNTESWATDATRPTEPKRIPTFGMFHISDTFRWVRDSSVLNLAAALGRAASPIGRIGLTAGRTENSGVVVTRVAPGYAADKAGMRQGDVLVSVDGKPLETVADFRRAVAIAAGKTIRITMRRKLQALEVRLPVEADDIKRSLGSSDPELTEIVWSGLNGNRAEAIRKLSSARFASDPRAQNDIGVLYEMNDEFGDAIKAYQRAIALAPKAALYHLNLGIALRSIGNPSRALEEFEEAARLDPKWVMPVRWQATILPEMDRLDDAVKAADELKTKFAKHGEAWRVRSTVLAIARRSAEAVEAAKKAVELEPYERGSWHELGDTLRIAGDLTGAEKAYRRAIQLDPSSANAVINLGSLLMHSNRFEEAEAVMRRSLHLKPKSVLSYTNLAIFLYDRGRPEEAERMYRHAMAAVPDSPSAFSGLANRLARTGQDGIKLDDALRFAKRGVALSGGSSFLELFTLGLVHQKRKEMREAEEAYLRCADLAGLANTHDWLWNRILETRQHRGDLKGAIELLQKVLSADPPAKSAASALAEAFSRVGRREEAFVMLIQALRTNPTDIGTSAKLSQEYWISHAKPVFEALRAALETSPSNGELLFRTGRSAIAVGDLALAEQLLGSALKAKPTPEWMKVWALVHLAEAREKLGNVDGAVASLLDAANERPSDFGQAGAVYNNLVRFRPQEAEAYFARVVAWSEDKVGKRLQIARFHFDAGRLEQAERLSREVLTMTPQPPGPVRAEAWVWIGEVLERRGQSGMQAFEEAIKADPNNTWALTALVDRLLYTNLGQAITHAKRLLALSPESPSALMRIGRVQFVGGNLAEAERLLNLAIKKAVPNDKDVLWQTWFHLGQTHEKAGRLDLARDAFKKAFTFNSTNEWLIRAMLRTGVSKADLNSMLSSAPSDEIRAEILLKVAGVHLKEGRSKDAEEVLKKALALESTNADFWFNIGKSLSSLGRHREAIESFRKMAAISFSKGWRLYEYAKECYLFGDEAEAESVWRRAIEQYPNDVNIVGNMAWLLIERGVHLDEGLRLALRALELNAADMNSVVNVGFAYSRLKDYAKAEEYLVKALVGTDWGAGTGEWMDITWAELGTVYEKLGKKDKAIGAYREALKRNSKEPISLEGLKRLGG